MIPNHSLIRYKLRFYQYYFCCTSEICDLRFLVVLQSCTGDSVSPDPNRLGCRFWIWFVGETLTHKEERRGLMTENKAEMTPRTFSITLWNGIPSPKTRLWEKRLNSYFLPVSVDILESTHVFEQVQRGWSSVVQRNVKQPQPVKSAGLYLPYPAAQFLLVLARVRRDLKAPHLVFRWSNFSASESPCSLVFFESTSAGLCMTDWSVGVINWHGHFPLHTCDKDQEYNESSSKLTHNFTWKLGHEMNLILGQRRVVQKYPSNCSQPERICIK